MKIYSTLYVSAFIILLVSCKQETNTKDISKIDSNISPGLIHTTTGDLQKATDQFKSYLNTDRTIEITNEINHSQNAEEAGIDLDFNKVFFIDNPRYTVPLVEENPLMAFEFPIRIGFYQVNGKKFIVARSEEYFINRYGLNNSAALRSIGTLTETFLKQSSKAEYTQVSPIDSLEANGIITLKSPKSFSETVSSIQDMIEGNSDFKLFESTNFSEDADAIGSKFKSLHLFVFGNPKVGSELMQKNPNFSIDLPLKILVEDHSEGTVSIHFQDLSFTAKLHDEEFENELPKQITDNLKAMLTKTFSLEPENE